MAVQGTFTPWHHRLEGRPPSFWPSSRRAVAATAESSPFTFSAWDFQARLPAMRYFTPSLTPPPRHCDAIEKRYPGDALVEAPLTLPSSPPRPPRPRALGAPLALQASSVTLRTALFNPCKLHRGRPLS